jgi:hypothetical protein
VHPASPMKRSEAQGCPSLSDVSALNVLNALNTLLTPHDRPVNAC